MFKKKYNSPELFSNARQRIDKVQHQTADYLNERTSRWTSARIKIVLLLFCLLVGGANFFLIIKGLMPANGPPLIKRTKMSIPRLITDSLFIHPSLKNKRNDNIK
jgi:hypothetical protein